MKSYLKMTKAELQAELANAMEQYGEEKKKGYIRLLTLAKEILEKSLDMLGFDAPEKM